MARTILVVLATLFCLPAGAVLLQTAMDGLGLSLPIWAELPLAGLCGLVPALAMLSRRIVLRAAGWAIALTGCAAAANAVGPGRTVAQQLAWIAFAALAGAVVGLLARRGPTSVPFRGHCDPESEPPSSGDASSPDHRLQFSLRTLFVMIAAAAVVLGLFSVNTVHTVRQQRFLDTVCQNGGGISYLGASRNPPLVLPWPEDFFQGPSHDSVGGIAPGPACGNAELLQFDLGDLPDLTSVSLGWTPIGDSGLAALENLSGLETLTLGPRTTDKGLVHLKKLSNLERLTLRGTAVTGAGLAHLNCWPQLEYLDLGATQITDAGLVHLSHAPKLRDLHLDNTKLGDAGLAHLRNLPELTHLTLAGTKVTDAGLVHLKSLGKLRLLDLEGTQVTGAGMQHLKDLPSLGTLRLHGTKLTDEGLVHLKDLAGLTSLDLGNTKITDAGLVHLKELPKLRYLHLLGTQVTYDALRQFKYDRPDVEIPDLRVIDSGGRLVDGGRIGVPLGGTTTIEFSSPISRLEVVDPGVSRVRRFGPSGIQLTGLQVGNTTVTVRREGSPDLTILQVGVER